MKSIEHHISPTLLKDGSRVFIIGGGPAGSIFAIHLLRGAKRLSLHPEVTIVEKKPLGSLVEEPWLNKGCNYCAGTISPRLHEALKHDRIDIPDALIQESYTFIWIQGRWKNFPIKIQNDSKMYSVYRGSLPHTRGHEAWGFDAALLKKAVEEGAHIVTGEARSIQYDPEGQPKIAIHKRHGDTHWEKADFIVIAVGINAQPGKTQTAIPLIQSFQKIHPRFVPAKVRGSLIFELHVGRAYLKKYMHQAVYFIEYGSPELPLEHIALVPKGEFLTVTLIGKSIDQASLPEDSRSIIHAFLSLRHIKRIIPNLPDQQTAFSCICHPRITIRPARFPYTDRIAVIGDAAGSRLYKDGLFSAYHSAKTLAHTVLNIGMDRRSLSKGYEDTVKWMARNNRYGQIVFGLTRLAFSTNVVSRFLYQAFATELKIKKKRQRPFGLILWKIASGTADYKEIFRDMLSFAVLRSVIVGGILITLRNMLTEVLFGLKWGEYGRYPTVILKEKQDYFKASISAPIGIKLNRTCDVERMYAIKIRASFDEIFNEIIGFGSEESNFLKLRLIQVRRIETDANGYGSIIRYTIKGLGLSFDLQLSKCVRNKTLLYEVSDKFVDHGQLLFSVDTMADGNTRLVIYAAFDFKQGKTLAGKFFWRLFRFLFPAFIHDVVWNHALCRIKETVEYRKGRSS
jgi:flavin-dependent dehydrogenase